MIFLYYNQIIICRMLKLLLQIKFYQLNLCVFYNLDSSNAKMCNTDSYKYQNEEYESK